MRVAGLLSGTSVDGIDVAIVDVSGAGARTHLQLRAFGTIPYPRRVREALLAACNARRIPVAEISQLNFLVGDLFGRAILRTCKLSGIALESLELAGSHGQTIYHQGRASHDAVASTLQIGEPAMIAERAGIPVIADFRTADMAAGGQGAPLVPFMDYILYRHPKRGRVALNIGGIANITLIPAAGKGSRFEVRGAREPEGSRFEVRGARGPEGARGEGRGARSKVPRPSQLAPRTSNLEPRTSVIALDTGPGNMVIDALVEHFTAGRRHFDRGGRMALRGRVSEPLLATLLDHPFFRQRAPRTAGREEFGREFVAGLVTSGKRSGLSPEDLIATASALTADSIAAAIRRFAGFLVRDLVISGGGVHNGFLVDRLREKTGLRIMTAEDFGIPGDAKEAILFAILAYHTFRKIPANIPSATGARHPAVLGKLVYPYR